MHDMPVRRFKRYFKQIAVHRAIHQLDMLEVAQGGNITNENDFHRLRMKLLRKVNPDAGVNIIKLGG